MASRRRLTALCRHVGHAAAGPSEETLSAGPLHGVKVVDLTIMIAGPGAAGIREYMIITGPDLPTA